MREVYRACMAGWLADMDLYKIDASGAESDGAGIDGAGIVAWETTCATNSAKRYNNRICKSKGQVAERW